MLSLRVGGAARQAAGLPVAWLLSGETAYLGSCLFLLRLGEQITQVPRPFFDRIALLREVREAVINAFHSLFLVVKNALRDFVLDTERG